MFVYEWTIKDDDENEHLVKLKRDGRDNLIYLDDVQIDAIPNDFHHSPIFNYEYNFEILGKKAKITYFVLQKRDKAFDLYVNNKNVKDGGRENCIIPKLPIYGIISIVSALILTFFIEMEVMNQKRVLEGPELVMWAITPCGCVMFLRYFANVPVREKIPTPVAHVFRIFMQAIFLGLLVFILWFLKSASASVQ